jgi:hypothetical protein
MIDFEIIKQYYILLKRGMQKCKTRAFGAFFLLELSFLEYILSITLTYIYSGAPLAENSPQTRV